MTDTDKPKLLVVDDEPDMLDFLQRVLRRRFHVQRASSARDALVKLEQGDFDVLVTDQKMPHQTGVELLESINDRYPHLVKVLISGFTELPDIQRAVDRCGIHNYIVKPVDSDRLIEAIDEAFAARNGHPWHPPD